MGVCCRSKEIVYHNNISDLPIGSCERHEKNTNAQKILINYSSKNVLQKAFDEKTSEMLPQKHVLEEKEKKKNKTKLKFKNNSVKKVAFKSTKEFDSECNDNNNNNNVHRRRRRSEHTSKFNRNQRKSVTLMHNNFLLNEKLRGVEMKIPVMQETFITQKFGDPDKYYKKIKELGRGSYGSVYQAKNLIMDNIVAIKM